MKNGKGMIAAIFVLMSLIFSGCTKMIAVGEIETYCDENGYNYKDAGYCETPMEIFKNRTEINAKNKRLSKYRNCR